MLKITVNEIVLELRQAFPAPLAHLRKASKPAAPLTPAKARIDSLKRTKDGAAKNLKAERDRQKLAKAQHTIASVTSSIPKI